MKARLFFLCVAFMCIVSSGYAISEWDGSSTAVWTSGSGTEADPYLIESADNLAYMATQAARDGFGTYLNLKFKLTTDIDLKNHPWTPISIFIGTFDGNGHVIKGLNVSSTVDYTGLFTQVNGSGTVKSLGIESGSVVSSKFYVGAIVGALFEGGTIENCYNKASVAGSRMVGGIAGQLSGGTISDCYNRGNISGPVSVGGVVGRYFWQVCTMQRCYNAGSVEIDNPATGYVGSVCGTFADALKPSSVVVDNFYDFNVNNPLLGIGIEANATGVDVFNSPGEGGTPPKTVSVTQKTTVAMKSASFVSELGSAYKKDTENINDGYPVLQWEQKITTISENNDSKKIVIRNDGRKINVFAKENVQKFNLSIYTLDGKCILAKEQKNADWIVLNKGMHIVKLISGEKNISRKIYIK